MQKQIVINDLPINIIEYQNEIWYPVSYIGDKILLKDISPTQLKRNGYDQYIKTFSIDYGQDTGSIQDTYCISEFGLKQILLNCKIRRLSVKQKIAMKKVCEYINLDIDIDTEESFLNNVPESKWRQYDFWSVECIESLLKEIPNVKWQRCSKCNMYYPFHDHFFEREGNPNNKCELRTICKKCKKWGETRGRMSIQHPNKELHCVYKKYGQNIYIMFKTNNIIKIWEWFKDKHIQSPSIFKNKDEVLNLILYLHKKGDLKDNMFNEKDIKELLQFDYFRLTKITIKDIYKKIYNINMLDSSVDNFEDAKLIYENYLLKNNIIINELNIYTYNYWNLIVDAGLKTYLKKYQNNDILSFILKVYNYKYPAYKFKGGYLRHYIFKENRNVALKYMIEEDMKLDINKIPLYLTPETMRKNSTTMRNLLKKYYSNDLWSWINNIYPNMFVETDFNITVIRHIFDSAEEHLIHDMLKSKFKNVIYNQRNTENTIELNNMNPDWFIITDNNIYVVEYFGINVNSRIYNQRIKDYTEKTKSKIQKYESMNWLRKIYIYPEDLKHNFEELNKKLNDIV